MCIHHSINILTPDVSVKEIFNLIDQDGSFPSCHYANELVIIFEKNPNKDRRNEAKKALIKLLVFQNREIAMIARNGLSKYQKRKMKYDEEVAEALRKFL